jgi:hypothetical protein
MSYYLEYLSSSEMFSAPHFVAGAREEAPQEATTPPAQTWKYGWNGPLTLESFGINKYTK